MRVVVAGATGYVGSRLVPELVRRGHRVVAASSRPPAPGRFSWGADVEWARTDARDPRAVRAALEGADALVYLVHSMAGPAFARTDDRAATVMADAVAQAGVGRVVYLSGLVPDGPVESLSEHLRSRLAVEEILSTSPASTLALRAGMVVGAGSTSFEIMRQMAALTAVQPVPSWLETRTQAIAVVDVVAYLADAVERPDVVGHLDLGAPEVLTYAELLGLMGSLSGRSRPEVPLLATPAALVAHLAPLICAAPWRTVAALVHSLPHEMVVRRGPAGDPLVGDRTLLTTEEAVVRSLRPPRDAAEATTPGGDPQVLAGSDPAWVQPPRWSGRLPVVGGVVAAVPVLGCRVEAALGAGSHVVEHRLRGAVGALLPGPA